MEETAHLRGGQAPSVKLTLSQRKTRDLTSSPQLLTVGSSSLTCSYQGALILLNISNTQDNARHAVFVDEAPESRAGGERESKLNIRYGS